MLEPFTRCGPQRVRAERKLGGAKRTQGHWMRLGGGLDPWLRRLFLENCARRLSTADVTRAYGEKFLSSSAKGCAISSEQQANLHRFCGWSFRCCARELILRAIHLFAGAGRKWPKRRITTMEPSEVRLPYGELGGCRIRRGRGRTETLLRPGIAPSALLTSSTYRERHSVLAGPRQLSSLLRCSGPGGGLSGLRLLPEPLCCEAPGRFLPPLLRAAWV